jgi:hypothetical protein
MTGFTTSAGINKQLSSLIKYKHQSSLNFIVFSNFKIFFPIQILQFTSDSSHIIIFSLGHVSHASARYLLCFNLCSQKQISVSYSFIFVLDSNTWPTVPKDSLDYTDHIHPSNFFHNMVELNAKLSNHLSNFSTVTLPGDIKRL